MTVIYLMEGRCIDAYLARLYPFKFPNPSILIARLNNPMPILRNFHLPFKLLTTETLSRDITSILPTAKTLKGSTTSSRITTIDPKMNRFQPYEES